MTALERFLKKFTEGNPESCWIWGGAKDAAGYGVFWTAGKFLKAHRESWKFSGGRIPKSLHVLHKCDVRACVNPSHLFLGTQADNNRDMLLKGRNKTSSGSRHGSKTKPESILRGALHPQSKLTDGVVMDLRLGRIKGSQRAIASKYGVTHRAISKALKRETWKHIK